MEEGAGVDRETRKAMKGNATTFVEHMNKEMANIEDTMDRKTAVFEEHMQNKTENWHKAFDTEHKRRIAKEDKATILSVCYFKDVGEKLGP